MAAASGSSSGDRILSSTHCRGLWRRDINRVDWWRCVNVGERLRHRSGQGVCARKPDCTGTYTYTFAGGRQQDSPTRFTVLVDGSNYEIQVSQKPEGYSFQGGRFGPLFHSQKGTWSYSGNSLSWAAAGDSTSPSTRELELTATSNGAQLRWMDERSDTADSIRADADFAEGTIDFQVADGFYGGTIPVKELQAQCARA